MFSNLGFERYVWFALPMRTDRLKIFAVSLPKPKQIMKFSHQNAAIFTQAGKIGMPFKTMVCARSAQKATPTVHQGLLGNCRHLQT